jgi:uncharacterized phage protein (TIGR02218 family)
LISLLASDTFLYADLYTFTLRSGTVLRYTNADIDLTYGGNLYRSGGEVSGYALVEGGRMRSVKGLEVDTTTVTMAPGVNDLINGIPLLKAARQGLFDRAGLLKQRLFMAKWGDASAGAIVIFSGEVSDVEPSRTLVTLTVKSDIYLLNVNMPRAVYQAACTHSFGDSGCGVNRAAYAENHAATAASTALVIAAATGRAVNYFALGTLQFISGANAGLSRSVKSNDGTSIQVFSPFPNAPAAGDLFTVTPGCDKTIPPLTIGTATFIVPASKSYSVSGLVADKGVVMAGVTTVIKYDEGYAWEEDVTTTSPSVTMVLVTNPATLTSGRYMQSGGVYSFSAADVGRSVTVSFETASGTGGNCLLVYNNTARFKGMPFIPVPETAT